MSKAKIIDFPEERIVRKFITRQSPQTTDEIVLTVFEHLLDYAVTKRRAPAPSMEIYEYELALFLESTKSLLNKLDKLDHPLQNTAKDLFVKTSHRKNARIILKDYDEVKVANTN